MSRLEEEFAGEMKVIRLRAEEGSNNRLQAEYNVSGHPAFIVLDENSSVTDRFFGPQEERTLRAAMAATASE